MRSRPRGVATAARRSTSPRRSTFQTKPQIAAGLIRQTAGLGCRVPGLDHRRRGVRPATASSSTSWRRLELRYVVEVPVNTTVWTEDPASCVPPYGGRGRVPTRPRPGVGRVGGRGRVGAGVRGVADPEIWVRGRRGRWPSSSPRSGSGRCVTARPGRRSGCWCGGRWSRRPRSSTTSATPTPRRRLEVLAEVACTRHKVEDYFEDAKSYLGMAQYETRSWVGWHHHMSLVAMAHLFITLTRRDLGKKRRS